MYQTVYVPVDNSEYSNRAADTAIRISEKFKSKIIGTHVYAATMHDYRFKQMEYTLPEEYLIENELERQRKIHDSLITMGLELISDCYLDGLDKVCTERGISFQRRMMDGKHHIEIVKDIDEHEYDLVVLGVLGVGKTRDSQIGSVCEAVTRQSQKDVLVVKHIPKDDEPERDTIIVGIDGSPQSFGALMTGIELAKKFEKKLEIIGVYDPYLHYSVFNSIVDILNEKASKVFRFEEQNQLHEEIIDTGLAKIYQSHLNVAESIAHENGVSFVTKTLLDGKAFQKILKRVEEVKPWLLLVGRIGVHSPAEDTGLGSNTVNLLRLAECDVLLSTRLEHPELDLQAEESILWSPEAEERMERVPKMVRGIARTAILRLAIEQGHSVVTNSVVTEAMDAFMPKQSSALTEKLATELVVSRAKDGHVALCNKCGVAAKDPNPVKCAVCGGNAFKQLTADVVQSVLASEGGAEEETTFDGRKIRWTREAREQLLAVEDKYEKRRAKARIEKTARVRGVETISVEFARAVIEDEVGKVLFETAEEAEKRLGAKAYSLDADREVIATDTNGGELRSVFRWKETASARLLLVPAGFMRDKIQERAEQLALEREQEEIDEKLIEESILVGQEKMSELLAEAGVSLPKMPEGEREMEGDISKCPFRSALLGVGTPKSKSNVYKGAVQQVLNEVGLMSEMKRRRDEFADND